MDTLHEPQLASIIRRTFPDIPEREANSLAHIGRIKSYPAGVVLCREGAIESIFYLIVSGRVQVSKSINERESRILKPLNPGDFFGEYALMHDAPRTATVETLEPTTVLEVHKPDFQALLTNSTHITLAMVREVSRRLRENNELAIEDLRLKAGELAQAYQRLAHLEYTRREFLSSIAHELRTPLTAASGFLQIIKKGMLAGPDLNAALDTVAGNVQKIVNLVNDILFLQELDLILPDSSLLDIRHALEAALQSNRALAEANRVTVRLEAVEPLPTLVGDSKSLVRVFSAVLENAIKFSPHGGDVLISTVVDDLYLTVSVHDHGIGIPSQALPKIFDRFFHLEDANEHLFGGLGLGLAIASQVVNQHGGVIDVESTPGIGSTFRIRLPIRNDESQ